MKRVMFISVLFIVTVLNYAWIKYPLFGVQLSETNLKILSIVVGVCSVLTVRSRFVTQQKSPVFFEKLYVIALLGGAAIGVRYLIYIFSSSVALWWWIIALAVGVAIISFVEPKAYLTTHDYE